MMLADIAKGKGKSKGDGKTNATLKKKPGDKSVSEQVADKMKSGMDDANAQIDKIEASSNAISILGGGSGKSLPQLEGTSSMSIVSPDLRMIENKDSTGTHTSWSYERKDTVYKTKDLSKVLEIESKNRSRKLDSMIQSRINN